VLTSQYGASPHGISKILNIVNRQAARTSASSARHRRSVGTQASILALARRRISVPSAHPKSMAQHQKRICAWATVASMAYQYPSRRPVTYINNSRA